ncbi:hypothetical protein U1Q18_050221 [Sarracenia purpurea var. burkii]
MKRRIAEIWNIIEEPESEEEEVQAGRCYLCGSKKNRKTKTRCADCRNPICKMDHTVSLCTVCNEGRVGDSEDSEDEPDSLSDLIKR